MGTWRFREKEQKKSDWFGRMATSSPSAIKMKPFPPLSPTAAGVFHGNLDARVIDEWNHYYIRAINGEVRLWVNGEEVSGGTGCEPARGYICLESEGSPIIFRKLRIRQLP